MYVCIILAHFVAEISYMKFYKCISLDENLVRLLYSKERNVGKSLTLKTLAKARGIY